MTVKLVPRKVENIKKLASEILEANAISIPKFAELIGKMIAAEPGVKYAASHYKTLELDKDRALKSNLGNYDSIIQISSESGDVIRWWNRNIVNKPISHGK